MKELKAFLGSLRAGDQLTLAGDVCDATAGLEFGEDEMEIWEILGDLHRHGMLNVYMPGNHDPAPQKWAHLLDVKVDAYVELEDCGKRFGVIHGHKYDALLMSHPWLTPFCASLARKLCYINADVGRWVKDLDKNRRGTSELVRAGCADECRSKKLDGIVAGHTHIAMDWRQDGVVYINTGCWCNGQCNYAVIEGGELSLGVWGA